VIGEEDHPACVLNARSPPLGMRGWWDGLVNTSHSLSHHPSLLLLLSAIAVVLAVVATLLVSEDVTMISGDATAFGSAVAAVADAVTAASRLLATTAAAACAFPTMRTSSSSPALSSLQ
jgi:hypothetical protein